MNGWLALPECLNFRKAQWRGGSNVVRWDMNLMSTRRPSLMRECWLLSPRRGSIRPVHGFRYQPLKPASEVCHQSSRLKILRVDSGWQNYLADNTPNNSIAVENSTCCVAMRVETRQRSGYVLLCSIPNSSVQLAQNIFLNPVHDSDTR